MHRSFALAYNAGGMVTNVQLCRSGALLPETRAYAYDPLDRLVAESRHDAGGTLVRDVAYAYDLAVNRTQTVVDDATETYALGTGDRLATWGASDENTYTHDAAGCVTRIARAGQSALVLAWNSQYQLTAVSTNGVVVEAYGYDALGRRVYIPFHLLSGLCGLLSSWPPQWHGPGNFMERGPMSTPSKPWSW